MGALTDVVHYWPFITGAIAVVGVGVAAARHAYGSFGGRELQPFRAYIIGSLRLQLGRFLRPPLARQLGLRRYADALLGTTPTYLQVPSIQNQRLDLDKTYVRLSLQSDEDRVPDEALLAADSGAVFIFGEPGSGKSSLTLKLFREVCKRASAHPHQERLPVRVVLRSLAWAAAPAINSEWLLAAIQQHVTSVKALHNPEYFYDAFADGPGLIVFLDGLDEVPAQFLDAATSAIAAATADLRLRSSESSVILTARKQLRPGLPPTFLDSFGSVYTLEPFTPADMFSLVRRWPFPADSRVRDAARVFSDIQAHPSLELMCTNPLILAMYVAHDQHYGAYDGTRSVRLPDTRPGFYKAIVDELLLFRGLRPSM